MPTGLRETLWTYNTIDYIHETSQCSYGFSRLVEQTTYLVTDFSSGFIWILTKKY